MSIFHTLPLHRSQAFEAAPCGVGWTHGADMPHAVSWDILTHAKASEMVDNANLQLRGEQPARRFTMNFYNSVYSFTGKRRYIFMSEQNGVYHFRPLNVTVRPCDELLVREACTMVLNVTVRPCCLHGMHACNKITVHNMAGVTVFEYTSGRGDCLRAHELKSMVKKRLIADNKITRVSPIKLMMSGTHNVVRGTSMIIDNQPIRSSRVRAGMHGQRVITEYFGR
jgi:hypothetical protein